MLQSYRELLVWQKATSAQTARVLAEAEVVGKLLGGLIRSLKTKG